MHDCYTKVVLVAGHRRRQIADASSGNIVALEDRYLPVSLAGMPTERLDSGRHNPGLCRYQVAKRVSEWLERGVG